MAVNGAVEKTLQELWVAVGQGWITRLQAVLLVFVCLVVVVVGLPVLDGQRPEPWCCAGSRGFWVQARVWEGSDCGV